MTIIPFYLSTFSWLLSIFIYDPFKYLPNTCHHWLDMSIFKWYLSVFTWYLTVFTLQLSILPDACQYYPDTRLFLPGICQYTWYLSIFTWYDETINEQPFTLILFYIYLILINIYLILVNFTWYMSILPWCLFLYWYNPTQHQLNLTQLEVRHNYQT